MHFLYDNLSAQIIAAGMMLLLLSINVRSQRAVQDVTSFYALRSQQLAFIEVMERDLRNVTALTSTHEDSVSLAFQFQALTDSSSSIPHQVAYRRVWVRRVEGVDHYKIERYVDGVAAGGSPSILVDWQIEARNAEGAPVDDPADARQVQVRFEALSLARRQRVEGKLEQERRARWSGSYRPPLIQQMETI